MRRCPRLGCDRILKLTVAEPAVISELGQSQLHLTVCVNPSPTQTKSIIDLIKKKRRVGNFVRLPEANGGQCRISFSEFCDEGECYKLAELQRSGLS